MRRSRKREEKLIKQWMKHGDLPPEAVEQQEDSVNVPVEVDKAKGRLMALYILLGVAIVIVVVGVVLLLLQPG